jgi:DNA polymerase III epsilon subunit-like protein
VVILFAQRGMYGYHIRMAQEQIYASVDLELSGFDPAEDEIIEIGIVTFTVIDGQPQVLETWDSLVRPSSDIRGRILGLTGIDETAAANAPQWSEVADKVQDLLEGATIVGHGVDLDCKFLDARGVRRGAAIIDTLELAQIFLPTHHSYNLENVSHYLGAQQTNAHRALADAEAAYAVLVKIAGIYQALPESTRVTIAHIAAERRLSWMGFFQSASAVAPVSIEKIIPATSESATGIIPMPKPGATALVITPPGTHAQLPWNALSAAIPPWAVAYADRERVLSRAAEAGADAYLGAFELVSRQAVERLLDTLDELLPKEVIALLKVLVWQAQGTRHGILAEINWSIIGTEVKKLFVTGYSSRTPAGLTVTDFRSLPDFKDKRAAWVEHVDLLSDWLEQKSGTQVSWHSSLAALRQVYNPETEFGDAARKEAVVAGIASVDTFFSLVLLLLKKELHVTTGTLALEEMNSYALSRLTHAASNLRIRLERLGFAGGRDASVIKFLDGLSAFFTNPGQAHDDVRWIEFADTRCAFIRRPTSLAAGFQEFARSLNRVVFQTDIQNKEVLGFLEQRLGIEPSSQDQVALPVPEMVPTKLTVVDESEVLEVSKRLSSLPEGIIVFPTIERLKEYYDTVYAKLPVKVPVVAVGIHGGANKVLRNFEHSTRTVILAALPSLRTFSGVHLRLRQVIFAGLPWVDPSHPYLAAVARRYFAETEQYIQAMQLLGFVQSLRVFDFSCIQELELIAGRDQEAASTALLKQAFQKDLSTGFENM